MNQFETSYESNFNDATTQGLARECVRTPQKAENKPPETVHSKNPGTTNQRLKFLEGQGTAYSMGFGFHPTREVDTGMETTNHLVYPPKTGFRDPQNEQLKRSDGAMGSLQQGYSYMGLRSEATSYGQYVVIIQRSKRSDQGTMGVAYTGRGLGIGFKSTKKAATRRQPRK